MFWRSSLANPDVSNWDTSLVTNMLNMFNDADAAIPDVSAWNTSNVTTMQGLFAQSALVNPNVSGWDTSSVTDMRMFNNSGLTTENYDSLLTAWSSQTVNSGVDFGANSTSYCTSELARNDLANNDSWIINDAGYDCNAFVLAEILEDSASSGGFDNSNGISVTAAQLALVTGLDNIRLLMQALLVSTKYHHRTRTIRSNGKRLEMRRTIIVVVMCQ